VALFAPAGTSAETIRTVNAAVATAVRSPDFAQKLQTIGVTPAHSTAEALGALLQEANQAFADMVKAADYKMP
jgi:tripartite-type tricarboxylate transporter receptor subunit TctC